MFTFFATRLLGNGSEIRIANDLEFQDPPFTYTLSGVNSMTATVTPEIARLKGSDGKPLFVPWSTAIYAEANDEIRFGGIVTDISMQNEQLSLTIDGFVGYPHGQPYEGARIFKSADPIAVAKHIWSHLQSQQGANLGMAVVGDPSPIRIGTPTPEEGDEEGYPLNWWSTHDLGRVFDDLALEAPFDYIEDHYYEDDVIKHRLTLYYPERAVRRHDLRFAIDENVYVVPTVEQHGDDYASTVVFLGAGEGREMVREEAATVPDRLRRVAIITDKTVQSRGTGKALAQSQKNMLNGAEDIKTVIVVDHPHAPFGSYGIGDVIRLTGFAGWAGEIDMWLRITSLTVDPSTSTSTLNVEVAY